jgi:hypothetical protein
MRFISSSPFYAVIAALLLAAAHVHAQQAPDAFRWIDFHSAKDQEIVAWVTRTLEPEKWSAIREIGVEYDAALVITTLRATPQSPPDADAFTVWNLSLTNHSLTPLIKGANLRLLDWELFADGRPRELGALYDDCNECEASTFFTAFHYDLSQHLWAARWMRGNQAAPIWSTGTQQGIVLTQLYALLHEPNGRALLGTWSHFDYGDEKRAEDVLYRYDLDPFSGLERTQILSGKEEVSMKQRLCGAPAIPMLARGQDALLCQLAQKPRAERRPVTTPPANNRGQSAPSGSRH